MIHVDKLFCLSEQLLTISPTVDTNFDLKVILNNITGRIRT